MKTAKVFRSGSSQAVRLPAEFRFSTGEVFIRRDEVTGDVVLSTSADGWKEIFAKLNALDLPEDLWSPEDHDTTPVPDRVDL